MNPTAYRAQADKVKNKKTKKKKKKKTISNVSGSHKEGECDSELRKVRYNLLFRCR